MKAVVCAKYGPPETLEVKEIDIPRPGEGEVLIKVHATAINDFDWSLVRGKPYPYRLMFGLLKPKKPIPGIELAGTIEALGKNANTFQQGDAVYGDLSELGWGSFAEYVCVKESTMALKPQSMSFEEAAAIPHASMLAAQGLIDYGKIEKGQRVLINGAGGGMGTFGLQIAKLYGAEVTGVDTGEKLKMMQQIGFDHILDYQQQDFTKNGQRYDLILDAKTNRAPRAYARALKPHGTYVSVGGDLIRLVQLLLAKTFGKNNLHIVPLKQNKDLAWINELYDSGKIKPIIDGPYKLNEVPTLLQYFGEGKHLGKVVVSVFPSS